jgi:hypothetical protein
MARLKRPMTVSLSQYWSFCTGKTGLQSAQCYCHGVSERWKENLKEGLQKWYEAGLPSQQPLQIAAFVFLDEQKQEAYEGLRHLVPSSAF